MTLSATIAQTLGVPTPVDLTRPFAVNPSTEARWNRHTKTFEYRWSDDGDYNPWRPVYSTTVAYLQDAFARAVPRAVQTHGIFRLELYNQLLDFGVTAYPT